MIEIIHVSKNYGKQRIIDNISLTIRSGGITSIIGSNGAGKSTLLSMISRLTPTDSGKIFVDGLDVQKTAGEKLARRLSVLRQDNIIAPRLKVRDLVTFGRYPYSKGRLSKNDKEHIDYALSYLDLEGLQQRFLDELSGGQRQRTFVAMVICQNTDYILLDEPLNNLDMKYSVTMMKFLRRVANDLGKTIVLILHDVNFASCYSDTIIAMRNGKIIDAGSPEVVIDSKCLYKVYDIDVQIDIINGKRIAIYYT